MTKKKRKKSKMTKIEKINATPQEVLEAIFRAADGDDFQKSTKSDEEDNCVNREKSAQSDCRTQDSN